MLPLNYLIALTDNFICRFQVFDIQQQFHDVSEKVTTVAILYYFFCCTPSIQNTWRAHILRFKLSDIWPTISLTLWKVCDIEVVTLDLGRLGINRDPVLKSKMGPSRLANCKREWYNNIWMKMYYIAMGYIKNCTYSTLGCIIFNWTAFFWCSLKWNSLQSYTHNQSSPICHSQALLCKSLILCWFILEYKYDFNNFNLEKLLVTWFIISRPICKRHGLDLGNTRRLDQSMHMYTKDEKNKM